MRIYHLSHQKWETRFTLKELDVHHQNVETKGILEWFSLLWKESIFNPKLGLGKYLSDSLGWYYLRCIEM